MAEVGVHEAKTHFSELLRRVAAGEEIVVTRSGKPVARLVPARPTGKRVLGRDAGQIWMAPNFDDPIPEFEEMFENDPLAQ
jgi:prevent-host-death family protein